MVAWARSTPTRVGKTVRRPMRLSVRPVHPHACGENTRHFVRAERECGPPPRVWGKLEWWMQYGLLCRSTPTRVGKTPDREMVCEPRTVHPHACGENILDSSHSIANSGPPPRVWGKRIEFALAQECGRSTAHACGENAGPGLYADAKVGPPPRVWGKLTTPAGWGNSHRSTPTRVGKTHTTTARWIG